MSNSAATFHFISVKFLTSFLIELLLAQLHLQASAEIKLSDITTQQVQITFWAQTSRKNSLSHYKGHNMESTCFNTVRIISSKFWDQLRGMIVKNYFPPLN